MEIAGTVICVPGPDGTALKVISWNEGETHYEIRLETRAFSVKAELCVTDPAGNVISKGQADWVQSGHQQ